MARPTVRESYRAHVRAQILERAHLILTAGGEAEVTMTRLAEEMRLSIGSLYRYFSSREELLSVLWEQRIRRTAERTADVFGAETPAVGLHDITRAWVDAAVDDPPALVKLAEALERGPEDDGGSALASLAAPLVEALSREVGVDPTGDRDAHWHASALLKIVAAVTTPTPGGPPDLEIATGTVAAVIDHWTRHR